MNANEERTKKNRRASHIENKSRKNRNLRNRTFTQMKTKEKVAAAERKRNTHKKKLLIYKPKTNK